MSKGDILVCVDINWSIKDKVKHPKLEDTVTVYEYHPEDGTVILEEYMSPYRGYFMRHFVPLKDIQKHYHKLK